MDQIRLLLAIVLSILVFLVWDFFFMPQQQIPPNATRPSGQTGDTRQQPLETGAVTSSARRHPEGQGPSKASPLNPPEAPPVPAETQTDRPARTVTVNTPLYETRLSEAGACLTDFALKAYRQRKDPESPLKRLILPENPSGLFRIDLPGSDLAGLANGHYDLQNSPDLISVSQTAQTVRFVKVMADGRTIEKHYTFYPDEYRVKLAVVVKNPSSTPISGNLAVYASKVFEGEGSRFVFEGPSAFRAGHLTEVKIKNIEDDNLIKGPLDWVAIQDRYFMAALIPPADLQKGAVVHLDRRTLSDFQKAANGGGPESSAAAPTLVKTKFLSAGTAIAPRTQKVYDFQLFLGPKRISVLKTVGHNLDKAVKFGWFDVVARPCLWLMNQFYRVIPNYGLAIIFVTIVIKLIFWPLGNKSYKSMGEMKKIQPLMAEIREKYKDDKKKMNEEMMGLYKTYKINPLGGCLPMVVQIPVFIAFYRMLYQSIELRHAPFMLWIDDLSAPERLFEFDLAVPFMQPPAGIPVLTIIMGATMFLQQKLQPTPGDPSQAKIMMLMPLFLTVIFINFPSGLVLYFICNNLISIAQQHYITKKNA